MGVLLENQLEGKLCDGISDLDVSHERNLIILFALYLAFKTFAKFYFL
jgi:hypothetical protein